MTGTTEVVAVSTEARVVGDVSVSKQVSACEQTVQETVRRMHADVKKSAPAD